MASLGMHVATKRLDNRAVGARTRERFSLMGGSTSDSVKCFEAWVRIEIVNLSGDDYAQVRCSP